jgi:hypothetical protein
VLLLLLAGAVGTQGVAPPMAGASTVPPAAAMLAMTLVSLALVKPLSHESAIIHPLRR